MSDISVGTGYKTLNQALDRARHALTVAETDVRNHLAGAAALEKLRIDAAREVAEIEASLSALDSYLLDGQAVQG